MTSGPCPAGARSGAELDDGGYWLVLFVVLGCGQVRLADVSGVNTTLEQTGHVRTLGGALDVSAYRVVQEALTNVLKHAGGSRAAVRLDYRADGLVISVVDDGAPTTQTLQMPSGGHGLVGMRERVRLFGGALVVGACTGGGWSVQATLPMFEESA